MRVLLAAGPEAADLEDNNGHTPLHVAAYSGHLCAVEALLKARPGAAELRDKRDRTPLHLLMLSGEVASVEVAQLLLKTSPQSLHGRSSSGGTALHDACQFNATVEVVQLLLDNFPNASEERDNDGQIPLHLAAKHGSNLQVIQVLCNTYPQGLKTPVSNIEGRLPLHFAAGLGANASKEEVAFLLEQCPESIKEVDGSLDLRRWADGTQDLRTRNGALPLHRAVESGAPEPVVKLLAVKYPEGILVRANRGRGRLAVETVPEEHAGLAK
eukprot:scaffold123077_cov29-Prasinocladus_malaysianus.AAC.1